MRFSYEAMNGECTTDSSCCIGMPYPRPNLQTVDVTNQLLDMWCARRYDIPCLRQNSEKLLIVALSLTQLPSWIHTLLSSSLRFPSTRFHLQKRVPAFTRRPQEAGPYTSKHTQLNSVFQSGAVLSHRISVMAKECKYRFHRPLLLH